MKVAQAARIRQPGGERLSRPGDQEIIASSGITPRLWRLYALFWLVCLFFPLLYLARSPLPTLSRLAALAGLAAFASVYVWALWPHPLSSRRRLRAGPLLPVATILLSLLLCLAFGSAFAWLFLGASAITGAALPARRAFWAVTSLTLLTLLVCVAAAGGIATTDWLQVIPLVLLVRVLGLDMAGFNRLAEALWELNAARHELARQAASEERLRMARDLHDLLGHNLSLIALKSELAGRMMEQGSPQAAQEVAEIERVARQALREARQAIAGYRQQTLANELEGARQILDAAGITCAVEQSGEALPPGVDAALAWVVREGVTNAVRHSRARMCAIRIEVDGEAARVEITNDGVEGAEAPTGAAGSGLAGLAGRIAALGGNLEAGPASIEGRPGFRLVVELPIRKETQHKS